MRRKTLVVMAGTLALGLMATSAAADPITLAVGDAYFVGAIVDSIPSNPEDELGYINNLLTVAAGGSETIGTESYDRTNSSLSTVGLPTLDPLLAGDAFKYDYPLLPDPPNVEPIEVTGVTYILAKYDGFHAGALVWFVGALPEGSTVLPPTFFDGNKYAISHYALFVPVPDGGATLMLLGGALIGLGALRRRFSA